MGNAACHSVSNCDRCGDGRLAFGNADGLELDVHLDDASIAWRASALRSVHSMSMSFDAKAGSDEEAPDLATSSIYLSGSRTRGYTRVVVTRATEWGPSSELLQLVVANSSNISSYYDIAIATDLAKTGSFGVMVNAWLKATGVRRKVEEVQKVQLKEGLHRMKTEIEIMKHFDHPNLMMLFEVFEDRDAIHLVTEYCEGGSLSSRHIRAGHFSEAQTVATVRQIVQALIYLHSLHICHRDLKAENCLFNTQGPVEHCLLKVANFRHCCHAPPGKELKTKVGTLSHMAPEVFDRRYGCACDVWSCGVIAYSLVCGKLPFSGSTCEELQDNIRHGPVDFETRSWRKVNESGMAVMFLHGLLMKDPAHRQSAREAGEDPWLTQKLSNVKQHPMKQDVTESLQAFRRQSKLKRAAMHVLVGMVPEFQILRLKLAFASVDSDGDGIISRADLEDHLRGGLSVLDYSELEKAQAERYTYTEFLAAAFDLRSVMSPEGVCMSAFGVDIDDRGEEAQEHAVGVHALRRATI